MTTQQIAPTGAPINTSRRSLFGGAAALAILPTALVAAPHPDARLFALCDEFDLCQEQCNFSDDEPVWQAWLRKRDAAAEAIEDIVPTTADGLSAQASIAVFLIEENGEDEFLASDHTRMALITLRNMAEGSVA